MDSSSIELAGSEIESVTVDGGTIRVNFSRAIIIKTMTGSVEKTRWWQKGALVFEGASVEDELPDMPAICAGGDVGENIYTYRDMIPLPLESRGQAHCDLRVEGADAHIRIQAAAVRLAMEEVPKYIEHIRPE
ncbi:MAG: hypothetical protein P8Z31_05785 [Gammaproteobacteria bacterium]|jgi:hypothetical protein